MAKEQVDANGEPTDEPVDAGLTAYFAIHVTNHGPGTAFDVDVLDFAPAGTVWTVVDDGGFDCPDTIDDAGDSCTAESMAPGGARSSWLSTSEADCGSLVNNVEVSASNERGSQHRTRQRGRGDDHRRVPRPEHREGRRRR